MQKGNIMKNIFDILSGVGLTVPEDKKTDFEAAFNENYKTVNDYSKVKYSKKYLVAFFT